ncbi:YjgP/YjgQ family permease [Paucihalobacter ruber]|uniref:YjgP/YjgQ family permease n=1 Tax=Paucihalobacter ruber TaxID=2567861 RepID=A0A506PLU3_9FLAO|nr:LptF/LptG family permease [Paucihalobacter ruber]TPV33240.1 YjgP/YjgQ family permease [Paucihalobacter ruber]
MKILDRYILTTYLKTFFSVFIILMFIFVLQTIWLYITELAGKDLDLIVVAKFLVYFTPKMVPLVLPLTVLLSSIMVFGSFAENYEFAAMKSTGISLQRAMRSLTFFTIGLAILAFYFADKVIPWSEFESYNLRRNIAKVKPAMAIASGQFNEIGDINIYVESKSGDRGQYLHNVVIHKQKTSRRGNYTAIISKDGELISSEDSNILQLELKDGHYYEELLNERSGRKQNQPHAKSAFDTYIINVDLEGLNNVDLEEKSFTDRYNMLDVKGLRYTIDSLYEVKSSDKKSLANTMYNRSTAAALPTNINPKDTILYSGPVLDLFETKAKVQILNLVDNTLNTSIQILESTGKTFAGKDKWLNDHIIALHDKYALGFACIILFFVGAPLGALIRKGGIGLPMVIAIVLFLTYHFLGIFAKNSAKNGTLNPLIGSWVSTLVMLPLSVYLTSRATKDRGLFEFDTITEPIKKLFGFGNKLENIELDGESLNYLKNYKSHQLIEILEDQSNTATTDKKLITLKLLELKKDAFEEYKIKTSSENPSFKSLLYNYSQYKDYTKPAMAGYFTGLVLTVLHFVFNNNKLPELALASKDLAFVAFGFFLLYYVVSNIFRGKFYQLAKQKHKSRFLLLLFGLILCPLVLYFSNYQMKTDFDRNFIKSIK